MQINVIGGDISEEEKQAYVDRARLMFPDRQLVKIDIYIDGDFVELGYYFAEVPFERIRRITGYLVGDVGALERRKAGRACGQGGALRI